MTYLINTINLKNYGATGDGSTDDTTALNNFIADTGIHIIPDGTYAATGTLNAMSEPDLLLSSATTVKGSVIPIFSISTVSLQSLPNAYVYVRQDTSDRSSNQMARFERIVDTDNATGNGIALRGYTKVNVDSSTHEYSMSAEMDSYSDSSNNYTACSGVSNKYGSATTWGGHFQSKEWTIESTATAVTALIGIEVNTPAVGLDNPTANNGLGNRYGIDLIARTNESITDWSTAGGNDGDAEIGVGLRIRNDALTDGYYRYGLVIDDVSQTGNPNPITTGMLVRTSGADGVQIKGDNTTTNLRIAPSTPGQYGLIIQGSYSTAVMRVDSDQWIGLSTDATKRLRYRAALDAFVFNDNTNQRFAFYLDATPTLLLNGTQVLQERITGWTDQTATASRADLGSSPTTAQLASFCRALYDDLKSHGLIGT